MKPLTDETDLLILAELDMHARKTDTEIAGRLGLNTNTIRSRIDDLERSGVIKGYLTRIDFFRLGYSCNRVYIKLQHANAETKQKIMSYLVRSSYCKWCGYARGRFDVAAIFWSQNTLQFLNIWHDFKKAYGSFIKETVFAQYCGDEVLGLPFTKETLGNNTGSNTVGITERVKINDRDRHILSILSSDGRATYSSIARSMGLTPAAVKYRVERLVEKKVIVGFRSFLDCEKLGYSTYKVDFNLESLKDLGKIERYLPKKTNITCMIRTIGYADLEAFVCTRSSKELQSVLHEIKDNFSHGLRYDFFTLPEEVKAAYMPDF